MRSTSRALAAAAVGGLLSLQGALPALAEPTYPPACPAGSICEVITQAEAILKGYIPDSPLVPEQKVQLVFDGFAPNTLVTVKIFSQVLTLGTFRSDSAGVVRVTVALPAGFEPGSHTIAVTGRGADGKLRTLAVPVKVATKGTTSGAVKGGTGGGQGGIPFTGDRTALLGLVGAGLVGSGAVVVVAARRRRTPALAV